MAVASATAIYYEYPIKYATHEITERDIQHRFENPKRLLHQSISLIHREEQKRNMHLNIV